MNMHSIVRAKVGEMIETVAGEIVTQQTDIEVLDGEFISLNDLGELEERITSKVVLKLQGLTEQGRQEIREEEKQKSIMLVLELLGSINRLDAIILKNRLEELGYKIRLD